MKNGLSQLEKEIKVLESDIKDLIEQNSILKNKANTAKHETQYDSKIDILKKGISAEKKLFREMRQRERPQTNFVQAHSKCE